MNMRIMTKLMIIEEFKQYAQDDYACCIACKNKKEFTTIIKAFGSLGIRAWANLCDLNNLEDIETWYDDTCHEVNYKGYAYVLFFIHSFGKGDMDVVFYINKPIKDKFAHNLHKPCDFKTAIKIIKHFKKMEKYIISLQK